MSFAGETAVNDISLKVEHFEADQLTSVRNGVVAMADQHDDDTRETEQALREQIRDLQDQARALKEQARDAERRRDRAEEHRHREERGPRRGPRMGGFGFPPGPPPGMPMPPFGGPGAPGGHFSPFDVFGTMFGDQPPRAGAAVAVPAAAAGPAAGTCASRSCCSWTRAPPTATS